MSTSCKYLLCIYISVSIAIEDIERQGILKEGSIEVEYVNTRCDGVYGLGKTKILALLITTLKLLTHRISSVGYQIFSL